jgi:hypothetical protein
VKTLKSVESILKRELASTIREWLRQVKLVPDLSNISLSDSDRTGHLPKLFEDVLNRLNPVSISFSAKQTRVAPFKTVRGALNFP